MVRSRLLGGRQRRAAVAPALEPKLVLFDEPAPALDPELVGEVLDALRGTPADLLDRPHHERTRAFLSKVPS